MLHQCYLLKICDKFGELTWVQKGGNVFFPLTRLHRIILYTTAAWGSGTPRNKWKESIKMEHKEIACGDNLGEIGSRLCHIVGCGVSGVELLCFTARWLLWARPVLCACMYVCMISCFRRDAALEELAVKPITQFPVTLDDEVWAHVLMIDLFLVVMLLNGTFNYEGYAVLSWEPDLEWWLDYSLEQGSHVLCIAVTASL
jgi:hypothetical protein